MNTLSTKVNSHLSAMKVEEYGIVSKPETLHGILSDFQSYLTTTFLAGMPELTVKQQDYVTGKIKELEEVWAK